MTYHFSNEFDEFNKSITLKWRLLFVCFAWFAKSKHGVIMVVIT